MTEVGKAPVALAVLLSIGAIFVILVGAASIVGSYALTLHSINNSQDARTHLEVVQHQALCKQLVGLDNAREGIIFSPPTKTGTAELYVIHLVSAIHSLVIQQGCER